MLVLNEHDIFQEEKGFVFWIVYLDAAKLAILLNLDYPVRLNDTTNRLIIDLLNKNGVKINQLKQTRNDDIHFFVKDKPKDIIINLKKAIGKSCSSWFHEGFRFGVYAEENETDEDGFYEDTGNYII